MWRAALLTILTSLAVAAPRAYCSPVLAVIALHGASAATRGRAITAQNHQGVLYQTSEVTCGPAALANLLNLYFGDRASEDELAGLSGTYRIQAASLQGLRDAAIVKGYKADGCRMTLTQLQRQVERSRIPVLVHYETPTLHYALVVGILRSGVLTLDPSVGYVVVAEQDFLRRWSGKALVVRARSQSPNLDLAPSLARSATTRQSSLRSAGQALLRGARR
jgi:predicted double-glycine peptidase